MYIETNRSIFPNPSQLITQITKFWDQLSLGWKTVWGPHIHHGFYDEHTQNLSPQEYLIEKLVEKVGLTPNQTILDVGCGMGQTALYLAIHHQSIVQGITLSQKQIDIATQEAKQHSCASVSFTKDDAHLLTGFNDAQFDVVWSLESCEQFYDKTLFLKHAFRVLKPNGKLMIATWCAAEEAFEGKLAKDYLSLCKAYDLPYMPTLKFYEEHLLKQNFQILFLEDWSQYVKDSWDIGIAQLKHYSILKLLKLGGLTGLKFMRKLKLMSTAFQTGQLRYGVFVAQKPFP